MRASMSVSEDRWKAGVQRAEVAEWEAEALLARAGEKAYGTHGLGPCIFPPHTGAAKQAMVEALTIWLEEHGDDDDARTPQPFSWEAGSGAIFCPDCGGETTGSKRDDRGRCVSCAAEEMRGVAILTIHDETCCTMAEAARIVDGLRSAGILRNGEEWIDAEVRMIERMAEDRQPNAQLSPQEREDLERMMDRTGRVHRRGQGRRRVKASGVYGGGSHWMRTFASEEAMEEWLEEHPGSEVWTAEWVDVRGTQLKRLF